MTSLNFCFRSEVWTRSFMTRTFISLEVSPEQSPSLWSQSTFRNFANTLFTWRIEVCKLKKKLKEVLKFRITWWNRAKFTAKEITRSLLNSTSSTTSATRGWSSSGTLEMKGSLAGVASTLTTQTVESSRIITTSASKRKTIHQTLCNGMPKLKWKIKIIKLIFDFYLQDETRFIYKKYNVILVIISVSIYLKKLDKCNFKNILKMSIGF